MSSINVTTLENEISDTTLPSQINYLSASSATKKSETEICTCTHEECNVIIEEDHEEEKEEITEEESSEDSADYSIDWGPDTLDADFYLPGAWTTQSLEVDPWNDAQKPVVTFHNYKDLELNPKESEGILSDRIIASCSTYLDKSAETDKFVLCKVNLSKKTLVDIRLLGYHHYLQYVDLSWNALKEVEPLSQLPFLMYLDVSHNQLDAVLNFRAPLNLTYVNYSFNYVSTLRDLSSFWSIVYLDISHNQIKTIEGLQNLRYLRHLNLSFNEVTKIQNLNNMTLLTLNLQNNVISCFEKGDEAGFKTLNSVLRINLDGNQLQTLELFECVPSLQSLSCQNNEISELIEITFLNHLNFLTEVDLRGNPVAQIDQYVDVCISNVRRITLLDGDIIDPEKKIAVKNKFDPTLRASSYKRAATSLFLQHLNDPILGLPIVPFDNAYVPIIILVGTPACNKGNLSKRLCERHSRHTIYGLSHTTRPKIDEEETNTYHFIGTDKFWEMARAGEFLTVSQILGHCFGFCQDELGKTVEKPCVLILHMDLKGALTLRAKNSKTHLVLAMPSTQEIHSKFICEKYYNMNKDTCGRATVVVNWPEKAKEFLEKTEYIVQSQHKEIAKQIISDIIKIVIPQDVGEEEEEARSYERSYKMSSNPDYCRRITRLSSEPISILKSSFRKSFNESGASAPPNVTFFSDNVLDRRHSTNAGSSPSVTFHDSLNNFSYDKALNSISVTVIDESEPLSVLSQTAVMEKRESASAAAVDTKIWMAQSDALKAITDDILNWREAYLQFHRDNPGLFSEVIFTDEESDALAKLTKLLKTCITKQQHVPPSFEYQQDSAYQSIIATRLKTIHEEIKSEMSIGQKQLNEHRYYTPKGRPFESQLKKTKKEIIESMATNRKLAINYKLPKEVRVRKKSFSLPSGSTF